MRTAAVLLAAILLVGLAGGVGYAMPERGAGTGGVGGVVVCRDVVGGRPAGCGETISQGAPWIVVVGRPTIPAGTQVVFVTPSGGLSCVTAVSSREYTSFTCYSTSMRGGGWEPGVWRVRIVRPPDEVVAEASFQVTAESPEEALARYRGDSVYARVARLLGNARLGRVDAALREAEALERSSDPHTVLRGLSYHAELLAAQGRYAEAVEVDRREIALRRRVFGDVDGGSWEMLARHALLACDLPEAEQAAAQAGLVAPRDDNVTRLLVEIEQAKETCAAEPGR
jgi:hypothetical protein